MKSQLSAAQVYKSQKRQSKKVNFLVHAQFKKILAPDSNSTGNFIWAAIRKKICIVNYAFARKINEHKFLTHKRFQKIEKNKNRCKKQRIGSKRLKIGENYFFCVYFRPNLLWSTYFGDPTMQSHSHSSQILTHIYLKGYIMLYDLMFIRSYIILIVTSILYRKRLFLYFLLKK